jgi:DMSO/TMAO reductase YedYZ molybdopterin-dependent catalytic subunit
MSMRELPELPVFPVPSRVENPLYWLLNVNGLVGNPLSLSASDLANLPASRLVDDFDCEEGWVTPDLEWDGVSVMDVLSLAEPLPDAGYVTFSQGGFSVALTLEEARSSNAILALRLNGQPLTAEHGAPCRLVVAGKECYSSIKWLERIDITAERPADTAREIALRRIEDGSPADSG